MYLTFLRVLILMHLYSFELKSVELLFLIHVRSHLIGIAKLLTSASAFLVPVGDLHRACARDGDRFLYSGFAVRLPLLLAQGRVYGVRTENILRGRLFSLTPKRSRKSPCRVC